MEYKEAIVVLLKMLEERGFTEAEKEALLKAVGTLDAAALGTTRMRGIAKAHRAKRDKDTE